MIARRAALLLMAAMTLPAVAQQAAPGDRKDTSAILDLLPATSATSHSLPLPNGALAYTVTAGTLPLRDGTGARASQMLGRWDLYGKTGTTNDAIDAWFVGFQRSRVGAVWIGYPTPKSLGERETGGGLALPVWVATMREALKGIPTDPLAPPAAGLTQVGEDWFYEEFTGDAALARIGAAATAESAASAASEPR